MAVALLARRLPFGAPQIFIICVFNFPLVLTGSRICGSTPRTINDTFLQECFQATNGTICNKMWNMFRDAVIGHPYSNILPSNYGPLFDTFRIEAKENKTLFELEAGEQSAPGVVDEDIAGLLSAVEKTDTTFVSPSTVPLSRVVRAIGGSAMNTSWCSNSSLDDFIYEGTCPCSPLDNFQVELFNRLSGVARGTITYLTDGEKPGGAFRSDSFFSQYIVSNLSSQNVHRVVIVDVHRDGVGESCQHTCGTLQMLRDELQERSVALDCHDINGQVRNTSTTEKLARCLADVIGLIQTGKEVRPNTSIPSCIDITGTQMARGCITSVSAAILIMLAILMLTI